MHVTYSYSPHIAEGQGGFAGKAEDQNEWKAMGRTLSWPSQIFIPLIRPLYQAPLSCLAFDESCLISYSHSSLISLLWFGQRFNYWWGLCQNGGLICEPQSWEQEEATCHPACWGRIMISKGVQHVCVARYLHVYISVFSWIYVPTHQITGVLAAGSILS